MKQFFSLQRKYVIERVYQEDFKRKLFENLGLRNPFDEKKSDITFKYSVVNKNAKSQVNHMESEHTRSLQASKYIKLDNDVIQLRKQYAFLKSNLSEQNRQWYNKIMQSENSLNIRFCHEKEV